MDNPAQSQNNLQQNNSQSPQPSNTADTSVSPKTDIDIQTNTTQTDSVSKVQGSPVSGPSKESTPLVSLTTNQESNIVQTSEQEPVLIPEIKEVGVAAVSNSEQITLHPDVIQAGVTPAKTAVPVPTEPSGKIQVPMTEEEAKKTIKTHPAVDAAYGFGIEILKYFKKLHKGLLSK